MTSDQQESDLNNTVQKPGAGLNPYADSFCSKNLTTPEKGWEGGDPPEYLANGDLSLQDEMGGGFSSGDSPVSDSPPAPIMDGALEAGAPPPEFVPDPMLGSVAPMPLVMGAETESSLVGDDVAESLEQAGESVTPADMAAISTPVTVPNGLVVISEAVEDLKADSSAESEMTDRISDMPGEFVDFKFNPLAQEFVPAGKVVFPEAVEDLEADSWGESEMTSSFSDMEEELNPLAQEFVPESQVVFPEAVKDLEADSWGESEMTSSFSDMEEELNPLAQEFVPESQVFPEAVEDLEADSWGESEMTSSFSDMEEELNPLAQEFVPESQVVFPEAVKDLEADSWGESEMTYSFSDMEEEFVQYELSLLAREFVPESQAVTDSAGDSGTSEPESFGEPGEGVGTENGLEQPGGSDIYPYDTSVAWEPSYWFMPPTDEIDPSEKGPGQPHQGNAEGARTSVNQVSEASSSELAPADLRRQLQTQLEYYFSRDNLVQDHYLQSQMDGDQYVPIFTIANFNQVIKLTRDLKLIVEVLKSSKAVQVDETGTKVRPRLNRTVLMLREIPENTPTSEVEELFQHEKCPKLVHCEFAHNGYWYVTFNTDEDCASAYCFLRERNVMFRNKPVLARIKARPLVRSGGGNPYPSKVATQPQQDATVPFMRQQQAQFPIMATHMSQFVNQQQVPQPVTPFPLYNLQTMMPQWPNTAAHTFLDPGAMLTMNGLQATAVKPSTNHNRNLYHHQVRTSNNRGMGKPHHRPQSISTDKVPEPRAMDRPHTNHLTSTRTSPRNNNSHQHPPELLSQPPPFSRSRSEGSSAGSNSHFNSTPNAAPTPLLSEDSLPSHLPSQPSNTKADSTSSSAQHKRGNYRKSRRNDEGAKNNRMNPSHSGKEGKPHEPHFELEPMDFPSLRHGSSDNSSSGSAPEGNKLSDKLSDVVKGTTRPNNSRLEDKVKASLAPSTSVTPSPVATTATVSTPGHVTVTDTTPSTVVTSTIAATPLTAASPAFVKETEVTANGNHTSQVHASSSATAVESSAQTSKTSKTSSQHSSSPAAKSSWESSLTSKQATVSTPPVKITSAPSPAADAAPARLSYAQVARKQHGENVSKQSSEDGGAQQTSAPAAVRSTAQTTLREQSQTQASASVSASAPTKSASASANARPPSKEGPRKDFEPKEPRFPGGRGAKENRNSRQPRFDRRRTDRDVKVPAK